MLTDSQQKDWRCILMVNVNMLKAKIIEKNIEKKKIAECLGISLPSPPRRHGLHIVRDDFFIA